MKTYPVEQQCPPIDKMNIATDVLTKSNFKNIVVITPECKSKVTVALLENTGLLFLYLSGTALRVNEIFLILL